MEGETEKWYLDWLENKINENQEAKWRVKFDSKIQKDPLARAKGLTILGKTEITPLMDYESGDFAHVQQFETTLGRMKDAQRIGKDIIYYLGYSNFTFDLWMVLHRIDCNGPLNHRRQYLEPINRSFNESFTDLKQYKHEDNFKRILAQLTLEDVRRALESSKTIMRRNEENGLTLQQYKGCRYIWWAAVEAHLCLRLSCYSIVALRVCLHPALSFAAGLRGSPPDNDQSRSDHIIVPTALLLAERFPR